VYSKEGNEWKLYYLHRDYLGSIRAISDEAGNKTDEYSYDAWGRLRNPVTGENYNRFQQPVLMFNRGYTGHEHLPWFGLINMNARLYDPILGRFLSPDPWVQAPFWSQNFNRYTYAANNPLLYVDENGEFFFAAVGIGALLNAVCWGATIGVLSAAGAYTIGAAITGNWDWSSFGRSLAMGAVGGALGGGMSALGGIGALGSFGNTFGYQMLSQMSNNIITNAIFGNDITWGSLAGSLAGSLIGSALPNFNAVNGGAFKNAVTEIGFNSLRGAVTGFYSGAVQSIIDKNPNAVWQNALGGAISGISTSILNIAVFGTAVKFDDSFINPSQTNRAVYRTGGLAALLGGQGISWGRTAWANGISEYGDQLEATLIHEGEHWEQQKRDGFANFYGKTLRNYIQSILKYGSIEPLYDGSYKLYNYDHMAEMQKRSYLVKIKGYY